jgi:hypothetical protein
MNRIVVQLAVVLTAGICAVGNDAAQTFTVVPVKPVPHAKPIPPDYGAPPPKSQYLILPPVEYDHDYTGKITFEIVKTREELRDICGHSIYTRWTLACAFPRGPKCHIVMTIDDIILAHGWTPEIILRHEIGHCNGWPSDHPGQRPHDAK